MKVVVVGHVDHGKSTLIGRLFHDAGVLPEGRFAQLTAAADRRGVAFEFANFTDGLQAERDQNVTIDTTQILFRWNGREILFIDAPGHREFIKNMVTGASQADAALLVIDAVDGVSDQTRRHALLLTILGISDLVVVINKIDTVAAADRQARFDALSVAVTDVLASLELTPRAIVPAAASLGWNVISRASDIAWHDGVTVIEALDELASANRSQGPSGPRKAAVFSVQDVYRRDTLRWLVGRVESGTVSPGDAVIVLPSGHAATIDRDQYVG
ncbi:MAG: GTP-binding protein, partial [Acidobacteriota bacterium]